MPNWVRCVVSGIGKQDVLQYISAYDTICGDEEYLDFNKIIPMPEGLDIESGSRLNRGLDYLSKHPVDTQMIKGMSESDKDDLRLGLQGLINYLNCGFTDWYDWCWENWGTKWSSHDVIFYEDCIEFSTAWSCPVPVLQKLSELLQREISVIYADENCGYNTGELTFENGDITYEYYPDGGSQEAYKFYEKAWGCDIDEWEDEDIPNGYTK